MSETISKAELVARVMARGIPERGQAERGVRDMLSLLGSHLTADEALAFGRRISPALACMLGGGAQGASPAHEDVQVALRALGELLDEEMLDRLVRILPRELAANLLPPELGEPPPYANTPGTTLATGRPGHSHSVVKSDHPHDATKLSSGHLIMPEPARRPAPR